MMRPRDGRCQTTSLLLKTNFLCLGWNERSLFFLSIAALTSHYLSLHQEKGLSMKKLMMIALAAVAITAWTNTETMAQDYQNSYRFGVGLRYGNNFDGRGYHGHHNGHYRHRRGNLVSPFAFGNIGGLVERSEEPPYFAKFPPVYYNGIISRPYGVSPYAAPPGILPTEMTIPTAPPQAIHNPYFDQEIAPVSDQPKSQPVDTTDNKTTHIMNPYSESLTSK